jgi:hypothetical protein
VGRREKRFAARWCRIIVATGLGVFCCAARGQTISWNATSGSWTDPTKWSPQNVPDVSSEAALFASPSADNADATLDAPITIGTLTMSAAQPRLTIQSTGALTVATTDISSGDAQLIVQNGGQFSSTSFSSIGTTTINAGGQLTSSHYVESTIGDHLIAGTLDVSSGSLELNQGRLIADPGYIHAGTMTIASGAEFVVRTGGQLVTNSLTNGGQIHLDGGRASSTNTIQVSDGFVIGSGSISSAHFSGFSVLDAGTRDHGVPTAGAIHVDGDLNIESNDTQWQVDITSTSHDLVLVQAAATLKPFLTVQVAGSYIPAEGSEYVILTAGSLDRSGLAFAALPSDATRLMVENDDGFIGSFQLIDRFDQPSGDYELVLANFSGVPEPSSLMVCLALVPLAMRGRRRV